MPVHNAPGCGPGGTHKNHGNQISPGKRRPCPLTIRKVPADSVPYGDSISRNGQTVWAAYDGERLLCVAASAEEARRKGMGLWHAESAKQLAARQPAEGDGKNLEG